jgi:DNA-binding response OmpR family regulator
MNSGGTQPAHILLVDDEPTVLKVLGMSLRALGHMVVTAGTAGEALRLAEEETPAIDLLITDLRMPDTSGKELAARLLEIVPSARVLFVSGLSRAAAEERAGLMPEDHFLPKPVTVAALKAAIAAVLCA